MGAGPGLSPWVRRAAIFLAICYGLGAPLAVLLELRRDLLSQRFGLPPSLIYATSVIQFVCAYGVLRQRYARLAATALTVTTLGAVAAHLRIGSPLTATSAVLFTILQVWFGLASSGRAGES